MEPAWFGQTMALAAAALWAAAVVLFKKAGDKIPPVSLNLAKNVVGVVMFTATLPVLGVSFAPDISARDWTVVAASGILGLGLADALFFGALNRLGAGLNAIVDCLYSPFMILGSVIFLGDRVTGSLVVGAVLVVTAILLVGNLSETEGLPKSTFVVGLSLGATSMLVMALSVVLIKPILHKTSVWWVIWCRMGFGALSQAAWVAAHPDRKRLFRILKPDRNWKWMLPGAVIGTYLAMAAWLFGFRYTDVSVASVLNQTSTIFTLFLAWIFLKEPMSRRKIVAACLAFTGAAVVILQEKFPW